MVKNNAYIRFPFLGSVKIKAGTRKISTEENIDAIRLENTAKSLKTINISEDSAYIFIKNTFPKKTANLSLLYRNTKQKIIVFIVVGFNTPIE